MGYIVFLKRVISIKKEIFVFLDVLNSQTARAQNIWLMGPFCCFVVCMRTTDDHNNSEFSFLGPNNLLYYQIGATLITQHCIGDLTQFLLRLNGAP